MTKEQLENRINSIIRDAKHLEQTIGTVDMRMKCFLEEYRGLPPEVVRRAEWLACRLRRLIYETTTIRKYEYLLGAAEAQGICIHERDGIFELLLPGFFHGDSGKRPSEFLTDPLNAALEVYIRKHPVPRLQYGRCVVCYTLVFDQELSGHICSGVNNTDLKRYLDVAASYLLVDDSPRYIDVFHSVELGNQNIVRMAFMKHDRFLRYIREKGQRNHIIEA